MLQLVKVVAFFMATRVSGIPDQNAKPSLVLFDGTSNPFAWEGSSTLGAAYMQMLDNSGNPLGISTNPLYINSIFSRSNRGQQQTTITSSVSETTIITANATKALDLYGLILSNTSATGIYVTIKDSTAGTTRAIIYVPAGDTRGFMLPATDGIEQSAGANNNWTATCSSSIASLNVTALFTLN